MRPQHVVAIGDGPEGSIAHVGHLDAQRANTVDETNVAEVDDACDVKCGRGHHKDLQ